ncbi:hypothetical protein ATCC90586_011668 [Pythium insidiosum]|nr:hypothetical protein ATCC90586_011668 [Pythium insidiosum]
MVKTVVPSLAAIGLLVGSANANSFRRAEVMEVMQAAPIRYSCVVEDGFDYVGKDIKNVQAPLGKCCQECANVPECAAWTWTDFNGGTCWLKSTRDGIVVNPGAKSSLFTNSLEIACLNRENDVDFEGQDISNVQSGDVGGCCDKCRNTLGCRAYTWTDFNGGTCWLKSSVGQAVRKPGVVSVEAFPRPDPTSDRCVLENGVDFVGNDVDSAPAKSAGECCSVCRKHERCRAFTWTAYNGGTCWLKSDVGSVVANPDAVSARTRQGDRCTVAKGVDIVGRDVGSMPAAEAGACCKACRARDDCSAFTWTDFNGGTCWFKAGGSRSVERDGAESGWLRTWA